MLGGQYALLGKMPALDEKVHPKANLILFNKDLTNLVPSLNQLKQSRQPEVVKQTAVNASVHTIISR